MRFDKLPTTYQQQLDKLIERGMQVANPDRAIRYLSHLNYYRLAAYWLPFEADHATHRFKPGTSFDQVLASYIFDKQLRLLIMDAIERFEVSLRTQWTYHLAHQYGPHAHLDATNFKQPTQKPKWDHADNVAELCDTVRQSSEVFIRHLITKYDEELPPIWAICEVMTFGQLSRWYANLAKSGDRNAIARSYDYDEVYFVSFIHHLTIVRNFTAHHARVWNREFPLTWRLPLSKPTGVVGSLNRQDGKRIYNTLAMLACLIDVINPGNHWKKRLSDLINSYPGIQLRYMGFPDNWRELPLWKGHV
jgi:abortive infection bacteriophage resistance protein